jgi:hypothetical protein
MAAAVEVVELIGMEAQGAVGSEMKGNDDCCSTSIKERGATSLRQMLSR